MDIFLDAVKLQVLDNLLFVLDTEVCVMIWFRLHFTMLLNQLIKIFFTAIALKNVSVK